MNVLILGPQLRNASVEQHVLATGHRCSVTEAAATPALLADVDWIIVNGYAPILKKDIIAQVGGRVLNIHPSYLPYGRGIFPLFWALFHGWPTGVSLHLINEGIDTGPLMARKIIEPTDPGETLRTFNQRLLHEANQLFIQHWSTIASGEQKPVVQEPVSPALVTKNRTQSEAFVELLPLLWETPLQTVRELGNSYHGNLAFIRSSALAHTLTSTALAP